MSSGRVTLEDYTDNDNKVVKNGLFIIDKVERTDAGKVTCKAKELFDSGSICTLRVKGKCLCSKFRPWPFDVFAKKVIGS